MKPNGRRRFRKMNARFRQRGSEIVRERARATNAGKARKMVLNDFWGGDPLLLPPRPFTPRSLVGMTQGARKRAARFAAWHTAVTYGREVITPALRRCIAADRIKLRTENVAAEYARKRARYRIGERLRPCKWCAGPDAYETCRGKRIAQEVVGGHRRGECVFCRTCADAKLTLRTPNPDACDGSGVLPAKRRGEVR